jgi:ribosomal protein S19E (S16A)
MGDKKKPAYFRLMKLREEKAAMKLKEAAMKLKKESAMKAAKPDFPDIDGDGNTSESMKKAAADKKSGMKMKKDDSSMKMGHSPKKMAKNAMKMKSPMKNEETKKSGTITKDEKGRVTRRTGDAAFDKTVQNIMNTTPGISLTEAKKLARKQLDASM